MIGAPHSDWWILEIEALAFCLSEQTKKFIAENISFRILFFLFNCFRCVRCVLCVCQCVRDESEKRDDGIKARDFVMVHVPMRETSPPTFRPKFKFF